MTEWKNQLYKIKNPTSGKTLEEESRIKQVEEENQSVVVRYSRDGLALEEKRQLEDAMYEVLERHFKAEQIRVLSFSEEAPQAQKTQPASQANLKVGHGPAGANKKRVPGVKKVMAVSSCKGGVGKSTVAVNLALSLQQQGYKVGLLDADIYGPSIPMLLGQREAKPMATEDKKIRPVEAHGLKFISFGLFIGESDPVIWRGPMLGGVLNQFLFDVDWGDLDLLIIDLPPGTGDMQLSMIQATEVDGAVVVSTPQSVALLDAKKGLQMFKQVHVPILGMIENMSYFTPEDDLSKKYYIFGNGGVELASRELGVSFLGGVPLELPLREGSDSGVPYMSQTTFKGRPVWAAFESISKSVAKTLELAGEKKGFFGRIFS